MQHLASTIIIAYTVETSGSIASVGGTRLVGRLLSVPIASCCSRVRPHPE